MREVYITGIGGEVGSTALDINDVIKNLGVEEERRAKKLKKHCGTNKIYRFSEDSSLEQASINAAKSALSNGRTDTKEVNGIYATTATPSARWFMPGLAKIVGDGLNLSGINMTSLSMGCVGGLDALLQAYNQAKLDSLEAKETSYLVIAGDQISRVIDMNDRATAPLFSDASLAILVTNKQTVNGYKIKQIGSTSLSGNTFSMRVRNPSAEGTDKPNTFVMEGNDVYEFAVKYALPIIPRLVGFDTIPERCYFIPHQGSGAILEQIALQTGLPPNRIYSEGISRIGNTPSNSAFFGLKDALARSLVANNQEVLIGVFGAELKVGSVYLEPVGNTKTIIGN